MKQIPDRIFAAEMTVGKLAKWLRIFGFDTVWGPDISYKKLDEFLEKGRIFLTRTTRIRGKHPANKLIFIKSNDPFEQLKEVIEALSLTPGDIRPFSRCIRCNTSITLMDKNAVYGKVPDYIWETHDIFHTCRQCKRIYWSGSHMARTLKTIDRLFKGFE